jgi:protein gp37
MADKSKIEWTEATWNPCTGCTKISSGCVNCYAERLSLRLKNMGQSKYKNGFKLTIHKNTLKIPLEWTESKKIFVNSMSDLFHKDVPEKFIYAVFDIMNKASWHQFQVLTKRPERALELNKNLKWTPNIWLGTTVEHNAYVKRIDLLRKTSAHIKFLSLEPLLGPINNLNLNRINWVIVGGESGPKSRPMDKKWVINIRDQCQQQGVPFFFKHWGGFNKKAAGRSLQGRTYEELPELITQ